MNTIKVILEGDGCWPDLLEKAKEGKFIHLESGQIEISALSGGMTSGKPSVSIRIELPDGKTVLVETSMALFLSVADALRARYKKELGEPG